jgi:uncharacterized membrane protein
MSTSRISPFGRAFARGLIVLVPLVLTVYCVFLLARWVDGIVPVDMDPDPRLTQVVPGVGVVLLMVGVLVIGAAASHHVGRRAFASVDALVGRVPIVRIAHSSLKDMMSALVGAKRNFDKPVFVTLSTGGGAKVLGYVTSADVGVKGLEDHVAVYFPQAYNFAGQVVLFPCDAVHALDAASSDVMTFIVSGGVSGSLAPPREEDRATTRPTPTARVRVQRLAVPEAPGFPLG